MNEFIKECAEVIEKVPIDNGVLSALWAKEIITQSDFEKVKDLETVKNRLTFIQVLATL